MAEEKKPKAEEIKDNKLPKEDLPVDKVIPTAPMPTVKQADEVLSKVKVNVADEVLRLLMVSVQNGEDIRTLDTVLTNVEKRLKVMEEKMEAVAFIQNKLTPWHIRLALKIVQKFQKKSQPVVQDVKPQETK